MACHIFFLKPEHNSFSQSTVEQAKDMEPCQLCGHRPPPIQSGMLPPDAHEAFPVQIDMPAPKRRKTVPFARVITSEEVLRHISAKEKKTSTQNVRKSTTSYV